MVFSLSFPTRCRRPAPEAQPTVVRKTWLTLGGGQLLPHLCSLVHRDVLLLWDLPQFNQLCPMCCPASSLLRGRHKTRSQELTPGGLHLVARLAVCGGHPLQRQNSHSTRFVCLGCTTLQCSVCSQSCAILTKTISGTFVSLPQRPPAHLQSLPAPSPGQDNCSSTCLSQQCFYPSTSSDRWADSGLLCSVLRTLRKVGFLF